MSNDKTINYIEFAVADIAQAPSTAFFPRDLHAFEMPGVTFAVIAGGCGCGPVEENTKGKAKDDTRCGTEGDYHNTPRTRVTLENAILGRVNCKVQP